MNRRYAPLVVGTTLALMGVGLVVTRAPAPTPQRGSAPNPGSSVSGEAGQWPSSTATITPSMVTVYDDGAPYADRWVVFHDENSHAGSYLRVCRPLARIPG